MRMKGAKILAFLLLAVTCMGVRCGCSDPDPCDNSPGCESVALGNLPLIGSSFSAIPFQGQESVIYMTAQGKRITLKAGGYENYPAAKYSTKMLSDCGDCSEYYQPEGRMLKFKAAHPDFTIVYALLKNVPEYYSGSSTFDPKAAGDVVAIEMNYAERFAISLDASPVRINAYHETKLHDSLILGARIYQKVTEVYYPESNMPAVSIKGIYYTKSDGLIGYYYANRELWFKE